MAKDEAIRDALVARFGEAPTVDPRLSRFESLASLAGRRVVRRYRPDPLAPELLTLLCACALSAPSKSDLQQRDILIVADPAKRAVIADLIPDQPFIREAPAFLVFLANGRRIPKIADLRGKPFPNNHLDLFFNASIDAALALGAFVIAAEAAGLGCCPISVIRDHSARISELLALPERVFAIAGLCVGWPADAGWLSPRLSLETTIHTDHFEEHDFAGAVDRYDRRRARTRPYRQQRAPETWGTAEFYGWSEDKARHYATPQRADFGGFVRSKGFCLD
jgi:nitroreductase/FMN reductase [NAD(P)H]